MFIGTSLGKCLKSILNGDVKEEQVMFIVSNTMCPTVDRLLDVVRQYHEGYGMNDEYDITPWSLEEVGELATRLFESGKLHQPRTITTSNRGHRYTQTWYEVVPTIQSTNAVVVEAYEKYAMLATLMR